MRAKAFAELGALLKDARNAATVGREGAELVQLTRVFDGLTRSVANVCARQSPRFDRARFLRESGLSG